MNPASRPFYEELFSLLGWSTVMANEQMLGVAGDNGVSLWFLPATDASTNNYDAPGTNHLAVGVGAQADVDGVAAFLAQKGIPALFETPRHREEFGLPEGETYYQVMFESPDGVLFEVVYTGPKS